MADLTKLENYVAGEVFKLGIDAILDDGVTTNAGDTIGTFIILFDSNAGGKIVSSTKRLKKKNNEVPITGEMSFEYDNEGVSGGILKIDTIPYYYTKNYLSNNEVFKPDGFAIVRGYCKSEEISKPDETKEIIDFLDVERHYDIAIKGILSNKPAFSFGTLFQFNASSITFGVTDANN